MLRIYFIILISSDKLLFLVFAIKLILLFFSTFIKEKIIVMILFTISKMVI